VKTLRFSALAAIAIASAVACSDDPAGPDTSPLAGLNRATANDTSNSTHQPTGEGPGNISGTVLGQSPPGAGNDSLATAPRVAGVVITIYTRKPCPGLPCANTSDAVEAGEVRGTVTTGADGLFTLPTLPSGEYVVTFVPPETAGYYGVWVHGELRENSAQYPWWIVLQKK
jgi:hypothetical protein